MPLLAKYAYHDQIAQPHQSPDGQRRSGARIRLSAQDQILVSAGAELLNPVSRFVWLSWSRGRQPAYGDLSAPVPRPIAWIAWAALTALEAKMLRKLEASNLGEDEEASLMNDLQAVQLTKEDILGF
jgi:hypothetical protein